MGGNNRRELDDVSPPAFLWVFRFVGIGFVLTGFGLIGFSFWAAVVVIYVGLAASLLEVINEPELIRRPLWLHVCAVILCCIVSALFTIGIAGARAPIRIESYAVQSATYPP